MPEPASRRRAGVEAGSGAAPHREPAPVPRLDRLSWAAAAAWFRRDPRLLLPVGTCLQHGPHLPLAADTLIVDRVAAEIARRRGILLAPIVPYGCSSPREDAYAGTASLDRKTLHRVLNDVAGTWAGQGLQELILLTAHGYGPHVEALATVVAGPLRVRAVDLNAVDVSPVLEGRRPREHAGEVETALLLYLEPELVGPLPAPSENGTPPRSHPSYPEPEPGSDGTVGRPWLATREKGRLLFQYLVRTVGERLET